MVGMLFFSPDQVREMSLAEIGLAIDGFLEFNGRPDKFADLPTEDEVEEEERLQKSMRKPPPRSG